MKIAPDKLGHLKAGVLIAAFGAAAGATVGWVVDASLWTCLAATGAFVAGLTAGLVKERADADDNRIAPGMHEVSWLDAVATAAPGTLALALWLML